MIPRATVITFLQDRNRYDATMAWRSDAWLEGYALEVARRDYSEDQPRGEDGKFGSGGGGAPKGESPERAAKLRDFINMAGAKISPDTKTENTTNGEWNGDRVTAVHDPYVEKTLAGVPKSDVPTVYMTGGGPASGKTSALLKNPEAGFPPGGQAVQANPDAAKEAIPEFHRGRAAGDPAIATVVHEESSHLSQRVMTEALQAGQHVVYDSTGDGGIDKLAAKVEKMRADGAKRVEIQYATLPIDEAVRRSDERADKPGPDHGRYVPHEYMRQTHEDVARTALGAIERGTFDALKVWDSEARTPVLVASYTREGGLEVKDPVAWAKFKARGEKG
jgi:hypothetical protein